MNDSESAKGEFSANGSNDEMESRMARLESAILALAESKRLEEQRPPVAALAQPTMPIPPEMLVAAGKALLPGALSAMSAGFAAATDPHNNPQRPSFLSPQSWLLIDIIQEWRTFGMMFLDFRFRPSWTVKIVPAICLLLLIMNFVLPGTGGVFHLFDVFPIAIGYKALSREALRYRAEMSLLPPPTPTS
jgi:hypothetical protein